MSATTQPEVSSNGSAHRGSHLALHAASGKISSIRKGQALADLTDKQWREWGKHFRQRKSPVSLAKVTGVKGLAALAWVLPDSDATAETIELVKLLGGMGKRVSESERATAAAAIEGWLAEYATLSARENVDWHFGISCLALAHACALLTPQLDQRLWLELIQALVDISHEGAGVDLEQAPISQQLLAGELPLTLALLFPEIDACRQGAKAARRTLRLGVDALVDGSGEIDSQHLASARGLLACWTRSAALSKNQTKPTFDEKSTILLRWFVQQSIATSRADGTQMLAPAKTGWDADLFALAVKLFGTAEQRKVAKFSLPSTNGSVAKPRGLKRLDFPASNSEWASSALLRSNWRIDSPRLLLEYSTHQLRSELCVDERVIWSGDCSPVIRIDGRLMEYESGWTEVCWHSDDDVDYVEIEANLTEGWKCQRQYLLDREDRMLYVADAILGTEPREVSYCCNWPVHSELQVETETETTEAALSAGKRKVARVLPLALPEWKCDNRRIGSLDDLEGELSYRLERKAVRLYAPLVIDLDHDRIKYPYTWRQLTLGQELEHVSPDDGVAYRVQLRLNQWLIYRSLSQVASRTVLGQNFYYEFVCGRFEPNGDVEPLIEVE